MTGSGTEPKLPSSELLRRLTPLERHEVRRFYAHSHVERRGQQRERLFGGRSDDGLARALMLGVASAIYRMTVLVALVVLLADFFWLQMGAAREVATLLGLVLVGAGMFGVRTWQLRRYLAGHGLAPGAPLGDRLGSAAAVESKRHGEATTASAAVAPMTGLPSLVAPELWARLSALERWQARRFYVRWLADGRVAKAEREHRDADVVIARRVIISSINWTALFVSVVPFMAFDAGAAGLAYGRIQAVISSAVFGSILVGIQILAFLRRRYVNRYFAQHF